MTAGQENRLRALAQSSIVGSDIEAAIEEIDKLRSYIKRRGGYDLINTKNSDELRHISKEIVREVAGGLKTSQYWGLRLRLIADDIEESKYNSQMQRD